MEVKTLDIKLHFKLELESHLIRLDLNQLHPCLFPGMKLKPDLNKR